MADETIFCTVYIAREKMEAEIVKGRLESEGIPALLKYESAGLVYGIMVNGLGQVQVQVPSDLVEEAREILDTQERTV